MPDVQGLSRVLIKDKSRVLSILLSRDVIAWIATSIAQRELGEPQPIFAGYMCKSSYGSNEN